MSDFCLEKLKRTFIFLYLPSLPNKKAPVSMTTDIFIERHYD